MVRKLHARVIALQPDLFARNLLLRSLGSAERTMLLPLMEQITLAGGQVLFEPGQDVTHVIFPLDGTVTTLLVPLFDGRTIETATVGREGAIGGVVSQGYLPAFNRAVVQIGGLALRIPIEQLQAAKQTMPTVRNAMTRYADCMLAQVLQSVACSSAHPIEQRSARWLLTLHDRLGVDELPITQEMIADMLGVRRTYLCGVLRRLQAQGLIQIKRRRVTILDRPGLEAASCECHGRVREHFAEVLGAVYRDDGKLVAVNPNDAPADKPKLVAAHG